MMWIQAYKQQMTINSIENSIIHHYNWPWCAIHKQTFLFLLLQKSVVFFAQTLCNFVTPYPHAFLCMLYLKNEEEKKKNEEFLSSKKEENQTLIRAIICLQMHKNSQVMSHSTMGESKNVSKGRKTQDL